MNDKNYTESLLKIFLGLRRFECPWYFRLMIGLTSSGPSNSEISRDKDDQSPGSRQWHNWPMRNPSLNVMTLQSL